MNWIVPTQIRVCPYFEALATSTFGARNAPPCIYTARLTTLFGFQLPRNTYTGLIKKEIRPPFPLVYRRKIQHTELFPKSPNPPIAINSARGYDAI